MGTLPLPVTMTGYTFLLMRRARRPVAVFMLLVLFQLMLVVGGYACVMRESGAAGAVAMAGMTMPGGDEGATPDRGNRPCEFPWAPSGCNAMAPCAPTAITVASVTALQAQRVPEVRMTLELLEPTSISRAPELPPPRA